MGRHYQHWSADCRHLPNVQYFLRSLYLHTWGISYKRTFLTMGLETFRGTFKSEINISSQCFVAWQILTWTAVSPPICWNVLSGWISNYKSSRSELWDVSLAALNSPWRKAETVKLLSDGVCMCDLSSVKTSLSNSCHTSCPGQFMIGALPTWEGRNSSHVSDISMCRLAGRLTAGQDIK